MTSKKDIKIYITIIQDKNININISKTINFKKPKNLSHIK
jgi:hypothetical protein